MTERPILFSSPMVRAILEGRKTQTRRLVKPQPNSGPDGEMVDLGGSFGLSDGCLSGEWLCPYGTPGDRLWVRENGWERIGASGSFDSYYYDEKSDANVQAYLRRHPHRFKRRPSIYMPRAACRLVLEVTAVRVERLQEISSDDAALEGVLFPHGTFTNNVDAYRVLWDSLNEKRAPWKSNPWVWVIEFRRLP